MMNEQLIVTAIFELLDLVVRSRAGRADYEKYLVLREQVRKELVANLFSKYGSITNFKPVENPATDEETTEEQSFTNEGGNPGKTTDDTPTTDKPQS